MCMFFTSVPCKWYTLSYLQYVEKIASNIIFVDDVIEDGGVVADVAIGGIDHVVVDDGVVTDVVADVADIIDDDVVAVVVGGVNIYLNVFYSNHMKVP